MQENILVEDQKSWKRLVFGTIAALVLALVGTLGLSAWHPEKAQAYSPVVQLSTGAKYGANVYTGYNCNGTRQYLSQYQHYTKGVHFWNSIKVPANERIVTIDSSGIRAHAGRSYSWCLRLSRLYSPTTWVTNSYQRG